MGSNKNQGKVDQACYFVPEYTLKLVQQSPYTYTGWVDRIT